MEVLVEETMIRLKGLATSVAANYLPEFEEVLTPFEVDQLIKRLILASKQTRRNLKNGNASRT